VSEKGAFSVYFGYFAEIHAQEAALSFPPSVSSSRIRVGIV